MKTVVFLLALLLPACSFKVVLIHGEVATDIAKEEVK